MEIYQEYSTIAKAYIHTTLLLHAACGNTTSSAHAQLVQGALQHHHIVEASAYMHAL